MEKNCSSLPEEAEQRRIILILSSSQLEILERESYHDLSVRQFLRSKEFLLLNAGVLSSESGSLAKQLKGSGLLNSGSLLIQSPYDTSVYANVDVAAYKFAHDKCVLFCEFCDYLAARKVSAKLMEIRKFDGSWSMKSDINSPYGGVSGQVEENTWNRMRQEVIMNGRNFKDEPKLEIAEEHIKQFQFRSDAYLNSLLRKRKNGVPMETRSYSLNLTQESKTNLDIAFSLNIPTQVGLKLDIQKVKQETFEFSVEYEIEFW